MSYELWLNHAWAFGRDQWVTWRVEADASGALLDKVLTAGDEAPTETRTTRTRVTAASTEVGDGR